MSFAMIFVVYLLTVEVFNCWISRFHISKFQDFGVPNFEIKNLGILKFR